MEKNDEMEYGCDTQRARAYNTQQSKHYYTFEDHSYKFRCVSYATGTLAALNRVRALSV